MAKQRRAMSGMNKNSDDEDFIKDEDVLVAEEDFRKWTQRGLFYSATYFSALSSITKEWSDRRQNALQNAFQALTDISQASTWEEKTGTLNKWVEQSTQQLVHDVVAVGYRAILLAGSSARKMGKDVQEELKDAAERAGRGRETA